MPFLSVLHRALLGLALLLAGCTDVWNNPYTDDEAGEGVLYSAFVNRPKHLDPVQAYSEDEATFLYQIYEPPLQYHYLKRPYALEPAAAETMPRVRLIDAAGNPLAADAPSKLVAYSVYEITIKPGLRYQPHPAFAMDEGGAYRYLNLDEEALGDRRAIPDFAETGSREVLAEDFVYQIKRLAHPRLHSPILELMSDYVVGLREYASTLREAAAKVPNDGWIDLRKYPLEGVELVDHHTYRIRLKGAYPQFPYWLAMPFFAPVPYEVDRFFSQPGMAERNLTLDWWPVGSGPFMLSENNPNSRMVLSRNPNYRQDSYPCEGEPGDAAAGLLADCGKALPLLDKAVFTRERESIPYWNKFLQGYYDASGVSSDNFDQAVQMGGQNDVSISDEMRERGISLMTSVAPTVMYMGFNMLDPVVGGDGERARKLRLAISIALDQEEFISVFLNGRGLPAMHPIPPGIFGYRDGEAGINPQVYDWVDGKARRKPVSEARRLLAEAGFPNGRDSASGEPLVIYLDTTGTGVGGKAQVDWLAKQFRKIDVQLVVRSTDYNRFQDKIRKGNAQLFYWGWNADYPDPENLLFLLYGPQGKVKNHGENAANYENAEFDRLFERMKAMPDGKERQAVIDRAIAILQHDAPWVWGFYEKAYSLQHSWLHNRKPGRMIRNGLKYQRIDDAAREAARRAWNRPVRWPLTLLAIVAFALVLPGWLDYRRRERATASAQGH